MRRRYKKFLKILTIILSAVAIVFGFFSIIADVVRQAKKSALEVEGVTLDLKTSSGKSVLFFSCNRMDYPEFQSQNEGIVEVFENNGILLDRIAIDSCFRTPEEESVLAETILCHLKRHPNYCAVIAGDDLSLSFVQKHRPMLFPDLPIVFMEATRISLAQTLNKELDITGGVKIHRINEILDIASSLNPDAKYVKAIVDGSSKGRGDREQFYSFSTSNAQYEFSVIEPNSMTMQEFESELKKLDRSTILIYLSGLEDSNGTSFTLKEMTRFINDCVSVPVYTDVKEAVGYGFFGGAVVDNVEAGRRAALTVLDVLDNKADFRAPLYTKSEFLYCFDFHQFRKWGFDQKSFPSETKWVNRWDGFWKNYGHIIIALMHIFIGGVLMIAIMAVMTFRSRIVQKELKSSRKQLEYMVAHDFLTGLSKIQSAHQVVSEMIGSGTRFSVVKINITNFKGINDAYSHSCGDAVLRRIGSLLMELDSSEYFVARDGSEFLVIHRNGYLSEVSQHFEHLRVTFLTIPFSYNNVNFDINTKMGIFNVPVESSMTDDEVLSAVNYALYVAKAGGKYKYVFFTKEMQEKIRNTKEVVKILDEACENDGFEAFFQPQIDVESGKIFGYESLCRLKNHTISPALFIPVAESNGFITRIGRIMTEKVVKQMASMRDDGIPLRQFAINYSAGQIVDTGYVDYLKSLLEMYNIPPEMIEIEITESLYLGKDQDTATLFRQLEELGVGLALDDFGTGYSSISYLTYVPVGVVKIDKTMVDIYLHDGKDVLIQNIINMVHSLGMKLVAEGIEEEWQYQKLKKFDCDVIQGYYFSKPMRGFDVKKFSV